MLSMLEDSEQRTQSGEQNVQDQPCGSQLDSEFAAFQVYTGLIHVLN